MLQSLTVISPHSTYYDRRLRQGPALIRARRPYLFKNAVTGLGLLGLVGGICTLGNLVANLHLLPKMLTPETRLLHTASRRTGRFRGRQGARSSEEADRVQVILYLYSTVVLASLLQEMYTK